MSRFDLGSFGAGRRTRRAALVGVIATMMAVIAGCGQSGAADRISVNGREVIVAGPSRGGAAPLIIALHGGLGNAPSFRQSLGLGSNSNLKNFRVAYLQGTPLARLTPRRRVWNAGACCGSAAKQGVNDVAFIAAVIQTLQQQGLATPGKVTLVGHSNGAMMAYRFACERGNMVQRVVAISASMTSNRCSGAGGVQMLHLHGASDNNVPVAGGRGSGPSGVNYKSVEHSAQTLRRAGGNVQVELVQGAGHKLAEIDAALRRAGKGGLASVIASYAAR